MLRMHLHRGARTGKKGKVPSTLEDRGPRVTRSRLSVLLITTLIGLFISAALLAPLAADIDWDNSKARASYSSHLTIMITDDGSFTVANGVSAGNGTASNPYIIEDWEIDASALGFGILIMDTDAYFVIRNVHVFAPDSSGIIMMNAQNGTIEGSLLDDGDIGIFAYECDSLDVTDNVIENQDLVAVQVEDSEWATISGNQFADNNYGSITLLYTDNCTVSSNTMLRSNLTGMMVMESNYTTITGNNASGSSFMGLYLDHANDTLVRDNDFTMNQMWGLFVNYSADVTIYHNRFIGNGVQAEEGNSTNVTWDGGYPDGGNYWSNYTGADDYQGPDQDMPGADGMGDTPFVVNGSGVDRYPWLSDDFVTIPEFGALVVPTLAVVFCVGVASYARRARGKR